MSSIIWMLWAADVSGSISFIASICWVAFVFSIPICGIAAAAMDLEAAQVPPFFKRAFARWWMVPLYLIMALGLLLPNKATFHAAIALHAGSELSKTAIGEKAYKALEATLDGIIEKGKK